MRITSKIALISLTCAFFSNTLAVTAISKTDQASQCPVAFPKTYQSPKRNKYIKIPALGIAVKASVDSRLVYIKDEGRYTVMSPPEYKSYVCSVEKGLSYREFYPYNSYLSYKAIKNPKKLPLEKALEESDSKYSEYSAESKSYGKIKLNGIDFITSPIDQGDPVQAWFIPKKRPDIIVMYSHLCNCGSDYKDLIDHLKQIKSVVK
jgi:hypothetical protein